MTAVVVVASAVAGWVAVAVVEAAAGAPVASGFMPEAPEAAVVELSSERVEAMEAVEAVGAVGIGVVCSAAAGRTTAWRSAASLLVVDGAP